MGVVAVLAVLVATAAAVRGPAGPGRARAAEARPNIVVIMTDDQTVDEMRFMPNVQRLITAKGTAFENSFVNVSLCCPSRATFLTGQYVHNHGVATNAPPGGGYYKLDSSNTLAVWLQKAGYFTMLVGKYLNDYGSRDPNEVPPGWSEWHSPVGDSPYRYYGFTLNENGHLQTYNDTYSTDLFTDDAVRLIRERAGAGKPFFLWLTYVAPHVGAPAGAPGAGRQHPPLTPLPATRDVGKFANLPLPMPPSFNEADVSDKPKAVRDLPLLNPEDISGIAAAYRSRAESLLAVDDGVDKIVSALEASGALDNTLLFFTSDNGYMDGEHRIAEGKIVPYEPSIRVPLVARGPGVPVGAHLQQLVVNADLAPTIVAAAQATPGRTMDGRSLLPLFSDPGLWWGRDILIEGVGNDASRLTFYGVQTPSYVYIEYVTREKELYDLVKDPYQLVNVQGDPAYATIQAELAARLKPLETCSGAVCRQGPAVSLATQCVGGASRVQLTGRDAGRVVRVQFSIGKSRIPPDAKAPFAVRTRKHGATRALAELDDGTRVSLYRAAKRC